MKRKRRKHTLLKTILLLLILLAAAAAVWWFLNGRSWKIKTGDSDNPMLVTQDSTAVAARETIRRSAEGSGTLEASREVTITADHTLGIETVFVRAGDTVVSGDPIASVDVDSIDEQILALSDSLRETNSALSSTSRDGSSSLSTPVSGRVRRIFAEEGDLLSEVMVRYGGIAEIAAAGELKVEFTPTPDVSPGMDVTVRFTNDDEDYKADGYIAEVQDGIATAVFDDSSDYDVDLEARVYDKADHLLGSGLTACRYPYLVEATYGKADEIRVSEGDWADSGSTILTRTEVAYNAAYRSLLKERSEIMGQLMELRQLKENPVIPAEENGIISSVLLRDKAPVRENEVMYTLMLTDRYSLKAQVDELDIEGVRDGQSATVVFDAFDDREYTGTVSRISSLGQNVNGVATYTVSIDLEGRPEFKSGMSGTAVIVTEEIPDALVIPVDAVQTKDEKKVVTVLTGDDLSLSEDREVVLGLVNHTQAQVTAGLSEGETVLVIGTTRMEDMINMMRASRRSGTGSGG